jgi:hypothetical protein
MLRSIAELPGSTAVGSDGVMGKVVSVYFDDTSWEVRYLGVDCGGWRRSKIVLLSPRAVKDLGAKSVFFEISRAKLDSCPNASALLPVARQYEQALHDHFNWPYYWDYQTFRNTTPLAVSETGFGAQNRIQAAEQMRRQQLNQQGYDSHLREFDEVLHYSIAAQDGAIGHVDDFIVELPHWVIRHVVVNTKNLLPGASVLLDVRWVRQVGFEDKQLVVDVKREVVRHAPRFDPAEAVNRHYEVRLYDYYGRPGYWASETQEKS